MLAGGEEMNCEEYIKEITRMLNIVAKKGDRQALAFVYKLLCKYLKTI